MKTLIVGGYGNFGARICRELGRRDVKVIAAGRHPEAGHAAAGFDDSIAKASLDIHDPSFAQKLKVLAPATVVHCVGPFQGQDYRVAEASMRAGSNYLDLADARSFVADFERRFDSEAIGSGLVAVSGASTLPALSTAVIDALKPRLASIEAIQIAIAPAQRSPRGVATLRAVFSYLGRPFEWREQGVWRHAIGWQELQRLHFKGLGW